MKNIPSGNGALCIARPGHELRLYGFLEKAKPIISVLTDGSGRRSESTHKYMKLLLPGSYSTRKESFHYVSLLDDKSNSYNINDGFIYNHILNGKTEFFEYYIKFITELFIQNKIDYVISDSSEDNDVINEICRILTDCAIDFIYRLKGIKIINYDFPITKVYNDGITDECIHIKLDEELWKNKIKAIANYHPSVFCSLKANLNIDENILIQLRSVNNGVKEIEKLLPILNNSFLKNEYIRPYIYKEQSEKPSYELQGEKLVESGVYKEIITAKHTAVIKEKLHSIFSPVESIK